MARHRTVIFTLDVCSFVPLDTLRAQGQRVHEVTLRDPETGATRVLVVPEMPPRPHTCAGRCHCQEGW